jgi:hypothetical protein
MRDRRLEEFPHASHETNVVGQISIRSGGEADLSESR